MEAQDFLKTLEECFPEQSTLPPFAKKPQIYSAVLGRDYQLFNGTLWTVEGRVSDVQGGCQFTLASRFGWGDVGIQTIIWGVLGCLAGLIVCGSHHVTPQQYTELTLTQRHNVDFWCSYPMFFAISLTAPTINLVRCWAVWNHQENFTNKILECLSSRVPQGLSDSVQQTLPTRSGDSISMTCRLTPAQFIEQLELELAKTQESSPLNLITGPLNDKLDLQVSPSNDFIVTRRTKSVRGNALVGEWREHQYFGKLIDSEGELTIQLKQSLLIDPKLAVVAGVLAAIAWALLLEGPTGLLGNPLLTIKFIAIPIICGVGSLVWQKICEYNELWFTDLIKRTLKTQASRKIKPKLEGSDSGPDDDWFE